MHIWESELTVIDKAQPASRTTLKEFATSILSPLSEQEIALALEEGATNPASWKLPQRSLPGSYLDFLSWSNGGSFSTEKLLLDPIFGTHEVRDYLLSYWLPKWMPGSLPLGFDGGGQFYLFDMRNAPLAGEFPIVLADSGNLDWEDAQVVAGSFLELITGRTHSG